MIARLLVIVTRERSTSVITGESNVYGLETMYLSFKSSKIIDLFEYRSGCMAWLWQPFAQMYKKGLDRYKHLHKCVTNHHFSIGMIVWKCNFKTCIWLFCIKIDIL